MKKSFTLIELLVVMAIIGILMGLMIAGTAKARSMARAAKATAEVKSLANAWKSYWIIYTNWPASCNGNGVEMKKPVMDILLGGASAGLDNPRKYKFVEMNNENTNGWVDPWGHYYQVDFAAVTAFETTDVYEASVFFHNRKRYDYD